MLKFQPSQIGHIPFLFFTGKGGVGKTSTACATAVSLADEGKNVLIVSTDPASNLQDVFGMELTNNPQPIKGVKGLYACNLDPEEAAEAYREKMIGPYRGKLPEVAVNQMEEQLSGACTVEIAAFDEFTSILSNEEFIQKFDHILFDTAPTGHTLRLLQLPTAWNGYLEESTHGVSCLGPLAGLNEKKDMYARTVDVLSNPDKTKLVLVSRPDTSSLKEAERASDELNEIGLQNQCLVINGVFQEKTEGDPVSEAFYQRQQKAISQIPSLLRDIEMYILPYVPYSLTGVSNIRTLFADHQISTIDEQHELPFQQSTLDNVQAVIDDFSASGTRIILTMGKGGVGKTTAASILAVGLAEKGHQVHLTTTDPAAHLDDMFQKGELERLTISRIDPKFEVEAYKKEMIAAAGQDLDDEALAYLEEDLNSPCTEEIAVFRAFAEVVGRSKNEIVIIDTAPTGHTLLLLDAAQSYHKELERTTGEVPESVKQLLPRLRNPRETSVVIVTLAEATPVFEAKRLQEDLKRAEIEPKWWIINQSLYATYTKDPILTSKAFSEKTWIKKVNEELASKTALIPWEPQEKFGYDQLKEYIK
ncbi:MULTISPECIES: arsenical pump-driving ATPase [Bacillus]|uniref:arsenical pump-driving ATPase n=1 Tax=Bacillus TaxID=1386 RepID=UPI000BA6E94F|nr:MULTISPECIES: arsenical pump-driving ATPase [Bacillus]MBA1163630.1 arsenical pump-driving ATPase [Bacillus licheniformis]MBS2762871.1 arsenical pump-driving ATPase [Bacillus licheniformis]PAK33323.1 arsenical pump-driving ATPase [Bacillus licheniformis]TWK57287.1 Arsenical pump-driving ATPase [Bacillus licheniformis]